MPDTISKTAILYQNHSRTVILIDIPTSIAQAQTAPGCPSFDALVSCEPLSQPYPSTEPKSESTRAKVMQQANPEVQKLHYDLRMHIQDALLEIRMAHKGHWCLPRHLSPIRPLEPKLRKGKSVSSTTETPRGRPSGPDLGMSGKSAFRPLHLTFTNNRIFVEKVESSSIYGCVVRNEYNVPVTLNMDLMYQFRIPPLSTFILSSIDSSAEMFMNAANTCLCKNSFSGPGQFDFILADPPWPNRSVHRAKQYKTLEHHFNDPWETIQDVLGQHLAPGGLVGIWVTNKAEPRKKVLTAFQQWNVQLVEEWVWIKTTLNGELVTELDGLWRRPYEVLLLGRKSYGFGSANLTSESSTINRRFICGVPDLHSRKPSLKELIEPLMPDRCSYRALEVFARNLTAGWWSWGDEVLKFNWEDNWVKDGLCPTSLG